MGVVPHSGTPKMNNQSPLKLHPHHHGRLVGSDDSPLPSLTKSSRSRGSPGEEEKSGIISVYSSPRNSPIEATKLWTPTTPTTDNDTDDSTAQRLDTDGNVHLSDTTSSVTFASMEGTTTYQTSTSSMGSSSKSSATMASNQQLAGSSTSFKASYLHENLMRCQTRDPFLIYDFVSVMGKGSMVRSVLVTIGLFIIKTSLSFCS